LLTSGGFRREACPASLYFVFTSRAGKAMIKLLQRQLPLFAEGIPAKRLCVMEEHRVRIRGDEA
jgi:hypothetical protein